MISEYTILLAVILIYLSYRFLFRKPKYFPPGPPAVPLLGSIPFLPHVSSVIVQCADYFIERYGKIVGMYLGRFPVVVIYDFHMAKELFSRNDLTGRPDNLVYKYRMLGKKQGLLFNDGESWKSHRRFTSKNLKDLGLGKNSMNCILQKEANHMVEFLVGHNGKPIFIQSLFNLAVLNILWTVVAGKRYDLGDPKAQAAVRILTESVQAENLRFLFNIPWCRHIFPEASGWNQLKETTKLIHEFVGEMLTEHKTSFNESDIRDFIDVYLKEIQTKNDSDYNDEQLLVIAIDLFSAGSETTSTTLAWAILYMILNPDVQKKVQEEIDRVIGRDKEPSLEDRKNMPYTEACIYEVQRLGSIVPMAIPHRATANINFNGYVIPKETYVFSILHHMMRDPNYWENAHQFIPERFIGANGQVKKDERLVPFGIGKRICLGESLAKNELFILFTRLLQKFDISASDQHSKPKDEPVKGFIYAPEPFYAVVKLRSFIS